MLKSTSVLFLLPVLIACSSDGNIHLIEEDVALALHTCFGINNKANLQEYNSKRLERSVERFYTTRSPRIDAETNREINQYNHERRNISLNRIHVLNTTNSDYSRAEKGGKKLFNTVPRPALGVADTTISNNSTNSIRTKRQEPLISKDNERCLSQCVFANLQVVDSQGIPRESELWDKVQRSVTSQQSRALLKGQIRACFQELQSESEDDGCSYSNKLERCLMLRFSDRKVNGTSNSSTSKN